MKKLILLTSAILLSSIIIAQNQSRFIPKKENLNSDYSKTVFKKPTPKTGEEVIFSEDFTGGFPEGWTIVDNSGYDMPWIWTTDTIFGYFINNTWINSESPETGYMAMPADGYNTIPQFTHGSEGGELAHLTLSVDSYFEIPLINVCNDQQSIILEFHTSYYYFTGMIFEVAISNDHNPNSPEQTHWETYLVNEPYISEVGGFIVDMKRRFIISSSVSNHDLVYIRFHAHSSTHYFWNVDDIKLKIPHQNNMELHKTWNFFARHEDYPEETTAQIKEYFRHGSGHYYQIPKSQVQAFVGSWLKVQNWGMNVQNNVKNETKFYHAPLPDAEMNEVFTAFSNSYCINPEEFDTLKIEGIEYLPEEYGYYTIENIVNMDNSDEYPEDNKNSISFIVNDSIYSRSSDSITSPLSTKYWYPGGYDGDEVGVLFTIKELAEIEAMKWYFHEKNAEFSELINAGYYTYTCKVYSCNIEEYNVNPIPIISSLEYTIELSDTGKWIVTSFEKNGNSEFLQPGNYVLSLETNTVEGTSLYLNPIAFYFGQDKSIPQFSLSYLTKINDEWRFHTNWNSGYTPSFTNNNPSFKMIIAAENWTGNDEDSVEHVKEDNFRDEFLFINYPNPAKGLTTIKYRLTEALNVYFQINNFNGKLIREIKKGFQASGNYEIELDVSEFAPGVYSYSLKTDKFIETKKLIVIK